MTVTVEMVVGYDGGGRQHEVTLVDGHETDAIYHEIDPDTRLRYGGHIQGWPQHRPARRRAERFVRDVGRGRGRGSSGHPGRRTPRRQLMLWSWGRARGGVFRGTWP